MQKLSLILILLTLFAFTGKKQSPGLKGTWEYRGGKFNNKLSAAPKGYSQQRKYTDAKFDAFLYEPGQPTVKYESGDYTLTGDTCLETQTFCLQDQSMVGKTVHYHYAVRNDTLILNGTLPNGAVIEDYWKRVK
ncbi:MAG: hypothetical protein JWR50_1285 [Mucilaginibacter sp.]|nr:hypothetical protein [Mucilaginibacter sp.]